MKWLILSINLDEINSQYPKKLNFFLSNNFFQICKIPKYSQFWLSERGVKLLYQEHGHSLLLRMLHVRYFRVPIFSSQRYFGSKNKNKHSERKINVKTSANLFSFKTSSDSLDDSPLLVIIS